MLTLKIIYAVLTCVLCLSSSGCRDSFEEKNKKLVVLVNTSFINDAKKKQKYRYNVAAGILSDKERISAVCRCAQSHCDELKEILQSYQPEVKYKRGPYRTSRLEYSADLSLLSALKGIIKGYEGLLAVAGEKQDVTIESVHELVSVVNIHKRYFYERARALRLTK